MSLDYNQYILLIICRWIASLPTGRIIIIAVITPQEVMQIFGLFSGFGIMTQNQDDWLLYAVVAHPIEMQ